jgi:hypothetical protein
MNKRQLRLKNMIDSGGTPLIINATFISGVGDIPFHWGDIEKIGYGHTKRIFDKRGEKASIDRYYTGSGMIMLGQHGYMQVGDIYVGEK